MSHSSLPPTPDVAQQPTLTGGGTVLRPWVASDAGALASAMQDPEIVRWLHIDLPYTPEDAHAFIAATRERWAGGRAAHFVIERNGAFCGYLGVLALGVGFEAVELVYWTMRRGEGIATAAVRCAVEWLTGERGARLIELGMVDGNAASAAVAERAGLPAARGDRNATTLDGASADERIYEWPS